MAIPRRSTARSLSWILATILFSITGFLIWQTWFAPAFVIVPDRLLDDEFQEQTDPGNPLQERAPSSNQTYDFNGHSYSVAIDIASSGLPYLAGSSVAGQAYFLRDGRPIDRLPQALISKFAPNRPNDPLLLYLCIRTSADETAKNLREVSPIFIRDYRMPALNSFVLAPTARPDIKSPATNSRANCVPPIDISTGQAKFDIFTNGARTFTSARIEGHISVGALVGQVIAERLTLMSFYDNLKFTDQLANRVALPARTYRSSRGGGYTLRFDKGFVREGTKQLVEVNVQARGTATTGKVAIIAHPLHHYWIVNGLHTEPGGQFLTEGNELIERTASEYQIQPPRGDYTDYGDVVELELKNGRGKAYFEYNGGAWLIPRLTFTVMPAARLGDLSSMDGGEAYSFTTTSLPIGLFGRSFPWLTWLFIFLSSQLLLGSGWQLRLRKKLSKRA